MTQSPPDAVCQPPCSHTLAQSLDEPVPGPPSPGHRTIKQNLSLERNHRMARIYPFHALRYDPARVNMEDVVTQPYDKITPAMQERYYELSPYNLVRVILGKQFPTDTDEENVYTRAADTLRTWRREHILAEESE